MNRLKNLVGAGIVFSLLMEGCSSCSQRGVDKILQEKVRVIQQAPILTIVPLPNFPVYPIHVYAAGQERSPFQAMMNTVVQDEAVPIISGSDELQYYPLSQLSMVGTMWQRGQYWALIKTPSGVVQKAVVGQYLGTHYGKIIDIMPDKIILQEKLPSNTGWYERKAELLLVKQVN